MQEILTLNYILHSYLSPSNRLSVNLNLLIAIIRTESMDPQLNTIQSAATPTTMSTIPI